MIKKILFLLNKDETRFLLIISFFTLLGIFFEMLSFAIIIPFFNIIFLNNFYENSFVNIFVRLKNIYKNIIFIYYYTNFYVYKTILFGYVFSFVLDILIVHNKKLLKT